MKVFVRTILKVKFHFKYNLTGYIQYFYYIFRWNKTFGISVGHKNIFIFVSKNILEIRILVNRKQYCDIYSEIIYGSEFFGKYYIFLSPCCYTFNTRGDLNI